jgi:hypothetical protein
VGNLQPTVPAGAPDGTNEVKGHEFVVPAELGSVTCQGVLTPGSLMLNVTEAVEAKLTVAVTNPIGTFDASLRGTTMVTEVVPIGSAHARTVSIEPQTNPIQKPKSIRAWNLDMSSPL